MGIDTDGKILHKLLSIENAMLVKLSFYSIEIWILSPIILCVIGIFGESSYVRNGIWTTMLYFCGSSCFILGCLYLLQLIIGLRSSKREIVEYVSPMLLFVILFIWIIVCTIFSEEKQIAIYGYDELKDNLITYLFYGGIMFGGFLIASDKIYFQKVGDTFLLTSLMLILIRMVKCVGPVEFVLNSMDFDDRYIVFAVIVCFCMVANTKRSKKTALLFVTCLALMLYLLVYGEDYTIIVVLLLLFTISVIVSRFDVHIWLLFFCFVGLLLLYISIFDNKLLSFKCLFDENIFELWKKGVDLVGTYSIVGVGPQNSLFNCQNMFIQFAIYTGGTGLLIYLFAVIDALLLKKEVFIANHEDLSLAYAVVASYFVFGLTNQTYFCIAPILYFFIGVIMSYGVKHKLGM